MPPADPAALDLGACIASLERFPGVLSALLHGLPDSEMRRRGPKGAWSILEIVNHLADEEADDFPLRLRLTLEDPLQEWPAIDPEGWARQRDYNASDPGESLARFSERRARSVQWLRSLAASGSPPDWSATKKHPQGDLRAGDLMASWMAHDMLHLRQIAKRLWELAEVRAPGFSPAYAGPWGA